MRNWSLRVRLAAVGLFATGAALLLSSFALLAFERSSARAALMERLEVQALVAAEGVSAALTFGDNRAAREALESLRVSPRVRQAVVYAADGSLFAEYRRPDAGVAPSLREIVKGIHGDSARVLVPVAVQGEPPGSIFLEAETREIDERVGRWAVFALAALALALSVSLFLLSRLQRAIVGPIQEMVSVTRRVAEDETSARASPGADDELGTLARTLNFMLDTIERRKAELDQASSRWRATFDAISDPVSLVDARGMLVAANRAARDRYRLDAEVRTLRLCDLACGKAPHDCPIDETLRTGKRAADRIQESGDRAYKVSADPIHGPDGRVTGAVHFSRDVTAERAMQERLTHAQRMEAVGRLAGGVAHDFNNILAVVIGYSGMLVDELPIGSMRKSVEEIFKAAQRGAALTRHLLAFSRKQVVNPTVIEVHDVVAGLTRMLGRLIGEHISLEVRTEHAGRVRIDPSQFEQVLVNLAVNARDAMPRGGRLSIEAATEEVPLATAPPAVTPGRWLHLVVSDTGTGMTPEVQARIFEPFFTTKPRGQGTGLGLSMVYGAVTGAGGHIDIWSEPAKGTRVSIWLPRVDEAPQPLATSVIGAKGHGERILVVEDDPQTRRVVRTMLEAGGYTVMEAGGAADAMERAAEGPALVLTDLVMPGSTGLMLARRLAEAHPDLPVLFMTGYADEALEEHPPPERLLVKPFSLGELLKRIQEQLSLRPK